MTLHVRYKYNKSSQKRKKGSVLLSERNILSTINTKNYVQKVDQNLDAHKSSWLLAVKHRVKCFILAFVKVNCTLTSNSYLCYLSPCSPLTDLDVQQITEKCHKTLEFYQPHIHTGK